MCWETDQNQFKLLKGKKIYSYYYLRKERKNSDTRMSSYNKEIHFCKHIQNIPKRPTR